MRRKIIAGNWKMNLSSDEADKLVSALEKLVYPETEILKLIFPPFIYLDRFLKSDKQFKFGAQNLSQFSNGAYTGEVSASMLKSIGCNFVLIGHSERRHYFNETEEVIARKIKLALENGLQIVYCIGETKEQRESNGYMDILYSQLDTLIKNSGVDDLKNCVIAYEPVWAIGTGLTATIEQVEEVHAALRLDLEKKTNKTVAQNTSLIYGGSCNAGNAKMLFACPNVDGGLIGGASLKSTDFYTIITSIT